MVTLEDLLEALVGEIADETDAETTTRVAAGSPLELDGSAGPAVVVDHFGVALPHGEAATFAGLLAELAGRIPAAGERFTIGRLEVDELQASPTRIERLLVRHAGAVPLPLDRRPD